MTKQQIIFLVVGCILVFGGLILIRVLFGSKNQTSDDLVKQLIAAKDSANKKEFEKVALYERIIEEKQRTNEALGQRDSVLNAHYAENEITYKKINETIKSIPIRIAKLGTNSDSLRRAFAEF